MDTEAWHAVFVYSPSIFSVVVDDGTIFSAPQRPRNNPGGVISIQRGAGLVSQCRSTGVLRLLGPVNTPAFTVLFVFPNINRHITVWVSERIGPTD